MRKALLVLGTVLVVSLGMARAKSATSQDKPKDPQAAADDYKILQEDIDKKNPVKPTPEGLAAARKRACVRRVRVVWGGLNGSL